MFNEKLNFQQICQLQEKEQEPENTSIRAVLIQSGKRRSQDRAGDEDRLPPGQTIEDQQEMQNL